MTEEKSGQGKRKIRYRFSLGGMVCVLAAAVAVAILTARWIPVFQIYGDSMAPTLQEGQVISFFRTSDVKPGDMIAFYHSNKVLIRRVIGGPGDWIDMDEDGTVYVNEIRLKEPYLNEKTAGDCSIELPLQVPEENYFVMGDYRETSVDSRNTAVGCISRENIIGKILFRIWPPGQMGIVN